MSLEEKYKDYTNKRLVEIVIKSEDYQPEAVETAKIILSNRDISNSVLKEVREAIEAEEQTQKLQEKRQLEIEKKAFNFFKNLINKINPFDKTEPTSVKIVNIALLVFGYLLLEQFYYSFRFLIMVLKPPIHFDIALFPIIFEVIYLPLTLYFFFKRKKIGWIMLVAWISYNAVSYIAIIIYTLNLSPADVEPFIWEDYKPNYLHLVLYLLFYLGSVVVLSFKKIRALFSISKFNMTLSISTGSLAVLIVMASIYLIQ